MSRIGQDANAATVGSRRCGVPEPRSGNPPLRLPLSKQRLFGVLIMQTFYFRVWSKHRTVPTEERVTVRDERRALDLARGRLKQVAEGFVVEIYDPDSGQLVGVVRDDRDEVEP